jgi:hypothetical protein
LITTLDEFMEANDWKMIDLAYHSGIPYQTVRNLVGKKHAASGNTIVLLDVLMCMHGLAEAERLAVIKDVTQVKANA